MGDFNLHGITVPGKGKYLCGESSNRRIRMDIGFKDSMR